MNLLPSAFKPNEKLRDNITLGLKFGIYVSVRCSMGFVFIKCIFFLSNRRPRTKIETKTLRSSMERKQNFFGKANHKCSPLHKTDSYLVGNPLEVFEPVSAGNHFLYLQLVLAGAIIVLDPPAIQEGNNSERFADFRHNLKSSRSGACIKQA